MTVRRVLVAWTILAVLGWLLSGTIWAGDEADCNEATSFICFDEQAIWLITGVYAAVIWLAGLFVISIVAGLLWWHRKLSDAG